MLMVEVCGVWSVESRVLVEQSNKADHRNFWEFKVSKKPRFQRIIHLSSLLS